MSQKFRTHLVLPSSRSQLSYKSAILTIGSCFSTHIGRRMKESKFQVLDNPFGVLYQPIAIQEAIHRIANKKLYNPMDLMLEKELWFSLDHHGSFSRTSLEAALDNINTSLLEAHQFFQRCDCVFVTLGTATAYFHSQKNKYVANCHKLPSASFRKERLTHQQVLEALINIAETLAALPKSPKVIFTLSPVRHIRDGLLENQVSKATLRLAIAELCERYEEIGYFPSYELLLDDLRDYRYYEKDMVHPNEIAVDYIWERFVEVYFDGECKEKYKQVRKLLRDLHHRPLHQDTRAYHSFQEKLLGKLVDFQDRNQEISFHEEIKSLQNWLS